GETEESFRRSCDLVEKSMFKNSYIFKYSTRPGTKADDLYPDDISEATKKRRNNDLLAIQDANSLVDHRSKIGSVLDILVEGPSKLAAKHPDGPRQLTGHTMTDHITVFDGNERLIGNTVKVLIEDATAFTLFGRIITDEVSGASLVSREAAIVQPSITPKTGRKSLEIIS
ncbi:MAG: TRAM domain-containing protein, partial [Planctomycetes bacterium]|nr:TRAM domain-containing protein [Planctomycetota bacterium]